MNHFVQKNGEFSRFPIKRKWYYSPAQALLHRLYPELQEYNFPDKYKDIVSADWVPRIDIIDLEDFFKIKVELPGIEKDNVSITIHNNELWIQGERRFENNETAKFYCREVNYGTFYRRIKFNDSFEIDKVTSELRNGILTILIPKKKREETKNITIK